MSSAARAVASAMNRIAPLSLAEKWDNVSLLLEAPHQPQTDTHKVLLTIDLTTRVAAEALALPASVIVSYHPTIFKPLPALTLSNPLQASLLRCVAAGISIFSPHTSLDAVRGGIADWLASGLEPATVKGIVEKEDEGAGSGRVATLKESVPLAVLVERIKKHLGLKYVQVAASPHAAKQDVSSVAICAGSGASLLLGHEADVYWTGEMSHHETLAAVAAGKHVILCGHSNTERGYLPILAEKLRAELAQTDPKMTVHISTEDKDPLEVV
ncbi:NGG1p interacting factor 3, partial [Peniophora sp. CONT]